MEKLNFVKDGAIRLPPGFRFQPTDEEIVFQYLARKITSCPLPASIIPDIDNICKYDPWNLPGELEQDRYFFSKKEVKYRNGNRTNRATGGGYWKATGSDKQIICPNRKHVIMGMRKTLVFYKGKPPHWSRTNWIMHEYRLVQSGNAASNSHQTTQNSINQICDWVLCHIFLKIGSSETVGEMIQPIYYDSTARNLSYSSPASSYSSCSSFSGSSVTEVSSYGSDRDGTSGRDI